MPQSASLNRRCWSVYDAHGPQQFAAHARLELLLRLLFERIVIGSRRAHYRELNTRLTLDAFVLNERERWPWAISKLNDTNGFYIEEPLYASTRELRAPVS